jgi:condensation domain-containing protein
VLAAALRILLYRWSGQADFLLGTISSNRSRSGAERMIGCFVNPLPLRNPVSEGQCAIDVLNHEKKTVMDAFAHQDCPFAKIVEAMSPERTTSDNPLFNVTLLLQNFPVLALNGRHFQVEYVDFDAQVALLDLRFLAMETRDGLQLSCEYKSSIFSQETVDTLLHAYAEVLQEITSDPAKPVSEIALPEPLMKQAAAARRRDHIPAVAITASFTAQLVEEPLNFLLNELGMRYRVTSAPYQQVFQQLLDPKSMLRTADGFGIVLVRFEDWLHGGAGTDNEPTDKLEQITDELIGALRAAQDGPAPLIVCFCPESRAIDEKDGWCERLQRLEAKVAEAFVSSTAVYVARSRQILDLYPVEEYEDEYAQRLGNVPYATDFFSALGTMLARRMWGVAENHYQVIAMECDQLLWSGRCGTDHPVVVDGPHLTLQKALLQQRDTGMLLCLCASGHEDDVWAAFENNPAMLLTRDDFVAAAFGSETSAERLQNLARDLGLELDSFVFLHSDAAAGTEVGAASPGVLALQVPDDPDEIPAWLKHIWAFDRFDGSR